MTVTAHNAQRVWGGASLRPTARISTTPPPQKRPIIGWGDCPVDQFVHLLSQHEAGAINLLDMPEDAGDVVEDDEPEEDLAEPVDPTVVMQYNKILPTSHLGRVLLCFASQPALTHAQMAELSGLTVRQIRAAMEHRMKLFHKQETEQGRIWRLKSAKLP